MGTARVVAAKWQRPRARRAVVGGRWLSGASACALRLPRGSERCKVGRLTCFAPKAARATRPSRLVARGARSIEPLGALSQPGRVPVVEERPGVEGGNRRPGPSQCLFHVRKMVIKHPRAWLGCAGAAGRLNLGIGLRPRGSAAMAAGYAPARRGSTTHGRPWLPFGALSARRRRGIRL